MELALMVGLCLWLMYGTAKYYQLHKFSCYMKAAINDLYATTKYQTTYINFDASYGNVKKSAAWNFNFDDMIQYEHKRAA